MRAYARVGAAMDFVARWTVRRFRIVMVVNDNRQVRSCCTLAMVGRLPFVCDPGCRVLPSVPGSVGSGQWVPAGRTAGAPNSCVRLVRGVGGSYAIMWAYLDSGRGIGRRP
jgi:hypothetical protein